MAHFVGQSIGEVPSWCLHFTENDHIELTASGEMPRTERRLSTSQKLFDTVVKNSGKSEPSLAVPDS